MSVQTDHPASTLDRAGVAGVLEHAQRLALISEPDSAQVLSLFAPEFPFAAAVAVAASVHLHVKVEDTRALPHAAIQGLGGVPQSEADGYLKYAFPGGVNLIFSSINISEDDLLAGEPVSAFPVLDHTGIDLRAETEPVRMVFDSVPPLAAEHGWRHVPQGGVGTPVYCCHTEVKGKHWVYPPDGASTDRPVEVAFGQLGLHDSKMGCDLRPIDPAHPRAAEAREALSACAASHAEAPEKGTNGAVAGNAGTSYYERGDLGHFADMGNHAKSLMDRFWAYYNATFARDGALTVREKALIGLAVAHSKQCPYCIDSFTNSCVDAGVSVDGMHEAVHESGANRGSYAGTGRSSRSAS